MRYPIHPVLWFWPPLWPFLAIITLIWALTHWWFWFAGHVLFVLIFTFGVVAVLPHSNPISTIVAVVFAWALLVCHAWLYAWVLVTAPRRRYARDVNAARYWQDIHDAARRQP